MLWFDMFFDVLITVMENVHHDLHKYQQYRKIFHGMMTLINQTRDGSVKSDAYGMVLMQINFTYGKFIIIKK